LLAIPAVIIGLIVYDILYGGLFDFVKNFPESVETWPNWLRWLLLLHLAAISVIFTVLLFSYLIKNVPTKMNVPDLLFVTIVGAFCACLGGFAFIVSGTGIAPRPFRVPVATLLSLIALGVDFALLSGLGASGYSLVIVVALVVGVFAGWKVAYDKDFF
jgi:hypothetical protein